MTFHSKIDSTSAGNTFVFNGFQPQADGFLKLSDIKGEFLAASLIDPEYDELAGGSRAGLIDPEYDELAGGSPAGSIPATSTLNEGTGFSEDALAHQGNGIIGYEIRTNQAINAEEWLTTGSSVDSLGDNSSMGIDQMSLDLISSINSRDMLAAANQLRSDNLF